MQLGGSVVIKVGRRRKLFLQQHLGIFQRGRLRGALGEDRRRAGAKKYEPRRSTLVCSESDDGVVAVAPRELEEHRALVFELCAELHCDDQLSRLEVDLEQALEEVL